MPRDPRLYITLPIDIHRHPKLRDASAIAKWTFVEMNCEARIADNDGVFTIEDAEFLWPAAVLAELAATHPSRPVLVRTPDSYVLREYGEHQQTKADREELSRKRAEAGAKGAAAKASNRLASANQVLSKSQQPLAESESESTDFYSPSKSQSRSNRARVSTDSLAIPEMTRKLAAQRGVTSLRAVVDAVARHTGLTVDASGALRVSLWILDKRADAPDAPQRYVTGAISKSPLEVQQFIHAEALEVA